MKHTTLLSVYKTILHDTTIEHNDFVSIVKFLNKFNGKLDKKTLVKKTLKAIKKVDKVYSELVQPKKRGRPKGSKNRPKEKPQPKNHVVVKEPWETNEEYQKRLKEENGK